MLLRGHSGFKIELIEPTIIRKSSRGSEAKRLERQIAKQIQFGERASHPRISTPRILTQGGKADGFHADMEFIAGQDFVEFLQVSGRSTLDDFLEVIFAYLEMNLKSSELRDVRPEMASKLEQLAQSGLPKPYLAAARGFLDVPALIPLGPCHGDLTLSNMLFKGPRIFLIDFLDGFVESPLQDVVKLRQDTHFGWSLLQYDGEYDATKVWISFQYLDRKLVERFAAFPWYQDNYQLMQLVNLMRIWPYCREETTRGFVEKSIQSLLHAETPENLQSCPLPAHPH